MNTLDLASKRVVLKKVSSTHGGEWQGPCPDPGCGGENRFHVWPEQNEGKGGYWCRGCGKTGDNIQFLRDFEGLSFREACARLNISVPERPSSRRSDRTQAARPVFEPETRIPPADLWQEKAEKFIAWSEGNLFKDSPTLNWLSDRGISAESAHRYRLGWNPGEDDRDLYRPRKAWGLPEVLKDDGRPKALWLPRGLVIPCIVDGVVYRVRIRRPEGEPRYYILPGSSMAVMIIGRERRAFVVVESELDAIACAESQLTAGAVALGSVSAKPDADAFAVLSGALQILNALDYDTAGAKAMAWWADHFDHCDRWPAPKGKDPGDAVRMGTDLGRWIKAGLPPALTIDDWRSLSKVPDAGKTARDEIICFVCASLVARIKPSGHAFGWNCPKCGIIDSVKIKESRDDTPAEQYIPASMTRGVPPLAAAVPAIEETVMKDFPPSIVELLALLKKNPGVKIINTPQRFTVLRDGKFVGGRINELVFRTPAATDYLIYHPAEEIDAANLIIEGWKRG